MKVVILCGGLGTRLSEETQVKPKPMVEIGGRPILWHIMKIYEQSRVQRLRARPWLQGRRDQGLLPQLSRAPERLHRQLAGQSTYRNATAEDWNVTLVDTGVATKTGGRLLRLKHLCIGDGTFMLTYGDGVSNVDIDACSSFTASTASWRPSPPCGRPARFGDLASDDRVASFTRSRRPAKGWINGGFFVFEPDVFEYIADDMTT